MLRNATLAVAAVLTIGEASQGSIIVSVVSAPTNPTNGPSGYSTDTFTLTNTDTTEKFVGFDFAAPFGFSGTMNQVNPAGLPTVYQDNNAFLPFFSATVDQDSQFKLNSTQGIAVNSAEGANFLQSAFAFTGSNSAGAVWALAQIARPIGGSLIYSGTVTTQNAQGVTRLNSISGVLPSCLACYSPTIVDAEINNVNANVPGTLMHTFALQSPAPIGVVWSDFQFDSYVPAPGASDTAPAIPATFDPTTHTVDWNTVGSPLGTYKWLVTASNPYGFDQGSLTVHITAVPEPATSTLICLAVVGGLGFVRHKYSLPTR
jgi:hypothetical protein